MIFFLSCLHATHSHKTHETQQVRANNLSKDQDPLIVLTFNMHRPLASFSATDTL